MCMTHFANSADFASIVLCYVSKNTIAYRQCKELQLQYFDLLLGHPQQCSVLRRVLNFYFYEQLQTTLQCKMLLSRSCSLLW